jgi:hypothetical protein
VPERDFLQLQKRAGEAVIRPEFAEEAMRELKAYRKTGKAAKWSDVKRKLGLCDMAYVLKLASKAQRQLEALPEHVR